MALALKLDTPYPIPYSDTKSEITGTVTITTGFNTSDTLATDLSKYFKTGLNISDPIEMAWFENHSGYYFWYDAPNNTLYGYDNAGALSSPASGIEVRFRITGRYK